jgi:hypothetical protein
MWRGGALFSLGIAGWIVCLDAFSRRGQHQTALASFPG